MRTVCGQCWWHFRGVEDSGENCVRSVFVVLVVQLLVLSFAPLQAQVSCLNKRSSGKWIQRNHDWTVGISVSCPCQSVAVWSWCRAGEEQGESHQASCDTLARDGKENNRGGRAQSCNVRKSRRFWLPSSVQSTSHWIAAPHKTDTTCWYARHVFFARSWTLFFTRFFHGETPKREGLRVHVIRTLSFFRGKSDVFEMRKRNLFKLIRTLPTRGSYLGEKCYFPA